MTPWAYIWNIFIFAGCAYVVFGLGHSGWWFAIPCALFLSEERCECGDEDE